MKRHPRSIFKPLSTAEVSVLRAHCVASDPPPAVDPMVRQALLSCGLLVKAGKTIIATPEGLAAFLDTVPT